MNLTKKQQIILAAVFFLILCLAVVIYMVSAYDKMEENGEMMSSENIAFYQQTKKHIAEEHKAFADSKHYDYESLANRYHNSASQYNPQFTISEGEQFCGDIVMQQNINYVTALSAITCDTRFECTAADWEETVQTLYTYIPDIVQLHNMYGTEELTEESLTDFIAGTLPAEAPADEISIPDPNVNFQLELLAGYYPDDDSYKDPHYKILLLVTDDLDQGKLPDEIRNTKN